MARLKMKVLEGADYQVAITKSVIHFRLRITQTAIKLEAKIHA